MAAVAAGNAVNVDDLCVQERIDVWAAIEEQSLCESIAMSFRKQSEHSITRLAHYPRRVEQITSQTLNSHIQNKHILI